MCMIMPQIPGIKPTLVKILVSKYEGIFVKNSSSLQILRLSHVYTSQCCLVGPQ